MEVFLVLNGVSVTHKKNINHLDGVVETAYKDEAIGKNRNVSTSMFFIDGWQIPCLLIFGFFF